MRKDSKWKTTVRQPVTPFPPNPADLIDLTDIDAPIPPLPTQAASKGFSVRKSLRIQAQADPSSTLTKAKRRLRAKAEGSISATGMPLIHNFPFHRLTVEQVDALFKVYRIQLGNSTQDQLTIIQHIQSMARVSFETIIHMLIDQSKGLPESQLLIVDEQSLLSITETAHDTPAPTPNIDLAHQLGEDITK